MKSQFNNSNYSKSKNFTSIKESVTDNKTNSQTLNKALSDKKIKSNIATALNNCRIKTLEVLDHLDKTTFCTQIHPDFSPVGWHFGHIAYTESLWLLERNKISAPNFPGYKIPGYKKLFAADGLPKSQRINLPSLQETRHYLDEVREKVLDYLEVADIKQQHRLWNFIIQHECQHYETINFLLLLQIRENQQLYPLNCTSPTSSYTDTSISELNSELNSKPIEIPSGEFLMGNDSIDAMDNESPICRVYLDTYYIEPYPVTCGEYRQFIEAGGYEKSQYWCEDGWEWLQRAQVEKPVYWQDSSMWNNHPVYGVSWYEADAYCRFVGKRLPTEAEWEKAASWNALTKTQRLYPWGKELPTDTYCNHNSYIGKTTPVNNYPDGKSYYGLYDTMGNVWEWTSTYFNAYEGFQPHPYRGYSQVYFDNQHRVLKGGSWSSSKYVLRCSTRNWYNPGTRQILAGFRCATDTTL